MTWTVAFIEGGRVQVEAKTHAEAKRKGIAEYKRQTGKRKVHAMSVYNSGKSNPTFPKGKFIPVEAVRYNANGSVTVKVKDSVMRRNPTLRKNIAAGFVNATGFHPIRSSYDYDPERASDEYGDYGSGVRKRRKATTKKRKPTTKKRAAPKRKATKKRKR